MTFGPPEFHDLGASRILQDSFHVLEQIGDEEKTHHARLGFQKTQMAEYEKSPISRSIWSNACDH